MLIGVSEWNRLFGLNGLLISIYISIWRHFTWNGIFTDCLDLFMLIAFAISRDCQLHFYSYTFQKWCSLRSCTLLLMMRNHSTKYVRNSQNEMPANSKDNEHTQTHNMKIIRNSQSKMKILDALVDFVCLGHTIHVSFFPMIIIYRTKTQSEIIIIFLFDIWFQNKSPENHLLHAN